MRLIDADAVKDVIAELNENGYGISPSGLAFVRNILLRMPTIEPKRGKWEKISDRNYKCSCCNAWWSVDRDSTMKDFNYCPNCGAKMDVADNDVGKIERSEDD